MDVTQQTADHQGVTGAFKNATLTGLLYESFTDNITANPGGGQGSATVLTTEVSRITTVATAGDSVMLPAAVPGLSLMIINHGAKPMQLYGTGTDTIDDQAAATGVAQMVNSVVILLCTVAGKWYANGLGTGFSGAFETQSYADALTAHAGGGQGSALLITTMISRFTVVATIADSAILPTSVAGMNLVVINASANSMNVFPDTGSTINGAGANVAYALAAGKTATFYTTVSGAWHVVLSA